MFSNVESLESVLTVDSGVFVIRAVATFAVAVCLSLFSPCSADLTDQEQDQIREALSPFNQVVGTWNANGRYRVRVPGQPPAWNGKVKWQWQLSKEAVGLKASFERGKLFRDGFLTYDLQKKQYVFKATRLPGTKVTFAGQRKDKKTFELTGINKKTRKKETLIVKLNHFNAYLWNFKEGRRFIAIVGCTIPGGFRGGDAGPKCVVTGGLGSSTVSYKGRKFYVCCSGCVQAFNDNPEKYIAEAEARKKAKKD